MMTRSSRSRWRRPVLLGVGVAVLAGTGAAVASSSVTVLKTGDASVKGRSMTVVVNSHGLTLYELSDERVGNLKCLSRACFDSWPPYEISATQRLTKAHGIAGNLERLRRVRGGFYQLMLNRHPLYRFGGDHAKGNAFGQGVKSYGGTWHVVTP